MNRVFVTLLCTLIIAITAVYSLPRGVNHGSWYQVGSCNPMGGGQVIFRMNFSNSPESPSHVLAQKAIHLIQIGNADTESVLVTQ